MHTTSININEQVTRNYYKRINKTQNKQKLHKQA